MAQDSKVNFRTEEVRLQMADLSDEMLKALAFQIEGQAKVNIQQNDQIDTSFMLNSVYVVLEDGSTYGDAKAAAESKNEGGSMAPEVKLEGGASAAVAVGAEYAVFQEERQSFLYAAAVQVGQHSGATIERVAKEELGG
jgi:hypothetical protein